MRLVTPLLCSAMLPALLLAPSAGASPFFDGLPPSLQEAVLWLGDHEEGGLSDWDAGGPMFAGGGIFNTGGSEVEAIASSDVAHSGAFSARATITNAIQAQNGSRAVRLMRWTDTAWNLGGDFFPRDSYYSTWMYFPVAYNPNKYPPWDPGDGGWWNVFQFKSDDAAGVSQPIWALNVSHDDATGEMSFYLHSKENTPSSYGQAVSLAIPTGQWVHVEAFYSEAADASGHVTIWQDGEEILDVPTVRTLIVPTEATVWGIGNYTDHIDGGPVLGTAVLYFDDAIVSTERISQVLPEPTASAALGSGLLLLAALGSTRSARPA